MAGVWFPLFIIFGSVFIGIFFLTFILTWMRSNRLRVYSATNKGAFINDYWMVEKINKRTGITGWQSVWFQPKFKTEKPPSQAVTIGNRGRKYATCYQKAPNEFLWNRFEGDIESKLAKGSIVDLEKVFTNTQRETVISQFIKAEEYNQNKKGWTPDKIMGMTFIIGVVMLVTVSLIFAPDVIKEGNRFVSGLGEVADKLDIAAGRLVEAQGTCSQYNTIPQTPPTQTSNTIQTTSEEPPTFSNG